MSQFLIIDSGACDCAFNMALDEALMEFAPRIGAPVLRFYRWTQPAASFGYFQKISDIERATQLRPFVRRPTGGGLVPHDRDWTYSVIIPPALPWYALRASESYERTHRWIQEAFANLNVTTELAPCCRKEIPGQCFAGYEQFDLLWHGRKIAGAAQRRSKHGLLIQGSIQPQPPNITHDLWRMSMVDWFPASDGTQRTYQMFEPPPELLGRAEALAAGKYSRDEYNRRR